MFTKKTGTMKPGWSQHPMVPRGVHPFGLPDTSHPGIPAHDACGFPHGIQRLCSQPGKAAAAGTLKVVCVPVGKGITCPSAVTHGSARHAPEVPPQSASLLQVPKRFDAELVVHTFAPVVPWSLYVFAIGCPTTIGAHGAIVVDVEVEVLVVVDVVLDVVVDELVDVEVDVLVDVEVEVLVDVVWDMLVDELVDVEVDVLVDVVWDVLVELVVTGALVEVDVLVELVVTGALVEVDVLVEDVVTGALVEVDVLVELVVTGALVQVDVLGEDVGAGEPAAAAAAGAPVGACGPGACAGARPPA